MARFERISRRSFIADLGRATLGVVILGAAATHERAIPYLAERLDRGFEAYPECRVNIDRPPSEYLKQFFYDTVNFDPKALRLAVEFAGVGQLLAGSDYPHLISSMQKMRDSIGALSLSPADTARILGGNAQQLYNIALSS